MRTTLMAVTGLALAGCGAPQAGTDMQPGWNTLEGGPPLVIAHRGASGLRPEHSLLAYELAIEQGADVIEPDLQMSADGVLIVRHDPYLSGSTDIADRVEFADRRTERLGREDWWVADFTAGELATLMTRQVMEDRSDAYDDRSPVLTFEAFLAFVAEQEAACGCTIGIAPEIKLPAEYAALGLDPLPALLAALNAHGLNRADGPVIVQSFDPVFLRRLNEASDVTLAMLYSGPDAEDGNAGGLTLEQIAGFADAVGPYKGVLFDAAGASSGYLETAHALGLEVHTWTVRDDREPVTGDSVEDELRALYELGVDAVFTDFPATAVRVRQALADGDEGL